MNLASSHDILGIVVPTNQPTVAFNFLLKSLHNMKEVAPISTFLFNFQTPWTEDQIAEAVSICKDLGFAVKYKYSSYEVKGPGLVPFNRIRNDTANLMPDAKFYLLMDDDMKILSSDKSKLSYGKQMLGYIDYMIKHPNCGTLSLDNSGNSPVDLIKPVRRAKCWTCSGLLLRPMNSNEGNLFPNDALDLVGWDEEYLLLAFRYSKGYYYAKTFSASCHHYEHQTSNSKKADSTTTVLAGSAKYGWNNEISLVNNFKFIKDRYSPNFLINRKASTVLDEQIYEKAGGIPHSMILRNSEYIYQVIDNPKLLTSIINYYKGSE